MINIYIYFFFNENVAMFTGKKPCNHKKPHSINSGMDKDIDPIGK